MAIIGAMATEHTPHDTNELKENVGFVPTTTGVAEVVLRDDSASVTLAVNSGQHYPYDVKIIKAASTTGICVVIFGEKRG
jgi:hypothetical protein